MSLKILWFSISASDPSWVLFAAKTKIPLGDELPSILFIQAFNNRSKC